LAIQLQIVRLPVVPSSNDSWMVVGHLLLVRIGCNIEPCHHPGTVAGRLA
jgi:hypothetical protein